MSDDSFGDDDDFDFDEVVRKAEETQRLLTQQNSRGVTREDATSETNGNMNNGRIQSSKLDNVVYQVKGENAVLRGQIAKLEKEQGEIQDSLRVKYEKMLKDKEEYIRSLTENLNKLKSEYEFAETENRNLMQQNIRSRKIRKIHHDADSSTPNTSVIESTQNTSYTSNNSNLSTHDTRHDQCLPRDEHSSLKVVIMNQAMFFQDEKTHFIESLTKYVVPGLKFSALQYLENITSTFDFDYEDFRIAKNAQSFKSAILKYLINFQDKNRIDHLLEKFILILLAFICETHVNKNSPPQLLPIPFLISLINFALDYRPKAIRDEILSKLTKHIFLMLEKYQGLFKPEFDYLTLPSSRKIHYNSMYDTESDEFIFNDFADKTMHTRILEVFTTVFLMDTLSTISKVASFHVSVFRNSKALSKFWSTIPQQFFINSLLSRKTPIHFIRNTITILSNSINDYDRFAFENIRKTSITNPKTATELTIKIMEQIMQFLTTITSDQIHFQVFGLNDMVGSNHHLKLLELVIIPNGESSSYPRTNSFDVYEENLRARPENLAKQEKQFLITKIEILNLFISFYSNLIMISLPLQTNVKLVKILCQLIGDEQEMIIKAPRSSNNSLRVEAIAQSVKILHHLILQESIVKINEIPNLALREMIIVLLKISSRNIKNYSIDFVKQVRESKYNGILFNGEIEQSELDRYGLWNSILSSDKLPGDEYKKLVENRIQIETDTYNGIEFNYPDETIDLARDIVGSAVTGDEADRLHDSINFVNYDDTANEDEDYQMDI